MGILGFYGDALNAGKIIMGQQKVHKQKIYRILNTISKDLSKKLLSNEAFSVDELDSGTSFTYGKLSDWIFLSHLYNRFHATTLQINVTKKYGAAYNPEENVLILNADQHIDSVTLASLIRHELSHVYQKSISKGKIFQSYDKNKHSTPHQAEDTREEYLKKHYEIDARFQQMLLDLEDENIPKSREKQINLILSLMDQYHLTDIFRSKGPRKKVRIDNNVIRIPIQNKYFNKLLSRAMEFIKEGDN